MYVSPGLAAVHQRIAALQSQISASLQSSATTAGSVGTGTAAAAPAASPNGTDFQQVLSRTSARLAGAQSTAGVPTGRLVDEHGRLTVPAELEAYGNGRIPPQALQRIGRGEHRLYGPAATACARLLADARRDGVEIGVTDSYRSYDSQVDLVRRKGLYSEGGLAAAPGTSKHGWGLALDLDLDSRAQAWMRTNAGRYGFVEDTPREPWHWAYHGVGT